MNALKDRAVLTFPQMKAAAKRLKKHKDLFLQVEEVPMDYYKLLIEQKKHNLSGTEYKKLDELRKKSGLYEHSEFIENCLNRSNFLLSNPICYVELWGPKLGKPNANS